MQFYSNKPMMIKFPNTHSGPQLTHACLRFAQRNITKRYNSSCFFYFLHYVQNFNLETNLVTMGREITELRNICIHSNLLFNNFFTLKKILSSPKKFDKNDPPFIFFSLKFYVDNLPSHIIA